MSDLIKNNSACLMLLILAPAATVALADRAEPVPGGTQESTPPNASSPEPLSVAPLDHVQYPEDRPDWVQHTVEFDKDAISIVVVSGPCDTPGESLQELRVMQRAAVSTYVSRVADSDGLHDFYPISDEEIESELVARRHEGTVMQGDVEKYEHAVELRFSDQQREQILQAWQNVEVRDRLGALGVLTFGGLLALIGSSALIGLATRRIERRERAGSPKL